MYGISQDVNEYFDKLEGQRKKKAQEKAIIEYKKHK